MVFVKNNNIYYTRIIEEVRVRDYNRRRPIMRWRWSFLTIFAPIIVSLIIMTHLWARFISTINVHAAMSVIKLIQDPLTCKVRIVRSCWKMGWRALTCIRTWQAKDWLNVWQTKPIAPVLNRTKYLYIFCHYFVLTLYVKMFVKI